MAIHRSRRSLGPVLPVLLAAALAAQSAAFVPPPAIPLPAPAGQEADAAPRPWTPDWQDVPADQRQALLAAFAGLAGSENLSRAFPAVYDELAPTVRSIHGEWSNETRQGFGAALDDAHEAALPFAQAYLAAGVPDAPAPQNQTAMPGLACGGDYHAPTQSAQGFAWHLVCLVTQLAFLATLADYGCYWMDVLRERAGISLACPRESVPRPPPLLPGGGGNGGSRPNAPSPAGPGTQQDADGDGIGDQFAQEWAERAGQLIPAASDLDGDGLQNLLEFRWETVPVCVPGFQNCADYERSSLTGLGGDGWLDGPEVRYWNDEGNDPYLALRFGTDGQALQDPDASLDTDGDALPNVGDPDSDGDRLSDGHEHATLGTYPEFKDSDCATGQGQCTLSTNTFRVDHNRKGSPGTGDRLDDDAELAQWATLGPGAYLANYDADSIGRNLLDPDADNDGLLDGEEFLLGAGQVKPNDKDSDDDGLLDGEEEAWSVDTDRDGKLNAKDPDSDNDGMPDKWEVDHAFVMVDPSDALTDRDGDLLNNLGEYRNGTDPDDMDTEDDMVLDGEEVVVYETDPHFWDTDGDAMPDRFEVIHGLAPRDPGDAGQDPDTDSFDRGQDGTVEKPWPNLEEYRYRRPTGHDEAQDGPYLLGTNPKEWDTDHDTAPDGFEAYYGTEARVPAEVNSDTDQDGLNWTMEVRRGTDPEDADTDNDGLCDGGRGARCFFPGGTQANQPGELDYSSIGFLTDSDGDGLSDPAEARLWDAGATGEAQDVDGDGLGGITDADSDDDGLSDWHEQIVSRTDMRLPDTDADALSDYDELRFHGTNPLDSDHDGDGLLDGEEATVHFTDPRDADGDDDGLQDGAEVHVHQTSPWAGDTDSDGLPDAWEAAELTKPAVPDAEEDPDADGLSNGQEQILRTRPTIPDTDGDLMLDGYESTFGLNPRLNDAGGDLDGDTLPNKQEQDKGTLPGDADTDDDGLTDGFEVDKSRTDPLAKDSDLDGLDEGAEKAAWAIYGTNAWKTDHDGDTTGSNLADADSDNDGLIDRDELVDAKTRPHDKDTDDDTLSDFDEVVTYGGRYDPRNADTDGDGTNDAAEVKLADQNKDSDGDGLRNYAEDTVYFTDRNKADTDCDGVQDGPEAAYWGSGWDRLNDPDSDGDGILDGIEIGAVGTPEQALYRSRPDMPDTDGDGLRDDQEARNNVEVACAQPYTAALAPSGLDALGMEVDASDLDPGTGLRFGHDANGWYVQGGYGVRLYVSTVLPDPGVVDLLAAAGPMAARPGTNGYLTDPNDPDTDGDRLRDGDESAHGADPTSCDSDGDGLGDALEVGVYGRTRAPRDPCTHLDIDPSTTTDPNDLDSDGDGLPDGMPASVEERRTRPEDRNANGRADLEWDELVPSKQYCYRRGGETDAADGDTDNDGLSDLEEQKSQTLALCFDTDLDGLSDGVEQGVEVPWDLEQSFVLGGRWPTWQPYRGSGFPSDFTNVLDPDSDDDGLLDALEDVDHDGVFGEPVAELGGQRELDPHNPDFDGDGLMDGRELLVYARSAGTTIGMTFERAMNAPGFGFHQMVFDPGNMWETDPRSAHTDAALDSVPDGEDLNPRADAFLSFGFQGLSMTNKKDKPDIGSWWAELYVDKLILDVPLMAGNFVIQMEDTDSVPYYTKPPPTGVVNEPMTGLVDAVASEAPDIVPPALAPVWKVQPLADMPWVLRFNLPEDATSLNLQDTSVRLQLYLKDDDAGINAVDNDVDLSPLRGRTHLVQSYSFGVGSDQLARPGDYLDQVEPVDHFGRDYAFEPDEDGILRLQPGDAVPKHFLEGLRQADIYRGLSRVCYGTATCVR